MKLVFSANVHARTPGCAVKPKTSFNTLYQRLKHSPRYKWEDTVWIYSQDCPELAIVRKWSAWMQRECLK